MYFKPHELQLRAKAQLKPERLEFEDVSIGLQCFAGEPPPSQIQFRIVEVLRTEDQTTLSAEWWEVRSGGQFGRSTAARLRFRGKAFSDRIRTDRTPADGALYETIARGGRVTLVIELLGIPENDPRCDARFDTLVVTLDYITQATEDGCDERPG